MSFLPLLCTTTAFLFVLLSPAASELSGLSDSTKRRREEIVARRGAVATDDGRCSKIGADVLRVGGHAVDAAVAASLCLGVVSPASSGIGGGAFMLLREANGKAQAFDMRETAPFKASMNMYAGNSC
ncbi:gamma-glutamyl transpeptidase 1 [Hibiscus trionum]|uniref:Gamma-glutamyl transpeptidase 1 n=1 Tax=Hibiscus trionum TaxID=183268 RepID=A0A9W7IL22_HIBTR|nr:gamma-glutamyl transpeptidase 1 [Hibiscus trionum]